MTEERDEALEKEEEKLRIKEKTENKNLPALVSGNSKYDELTSDGNVNARLDSTDSNNYIEEVEKLRIKSISKIHAFQTLEIVFLLILLGVFVYVFTAHGDLVSDKLSGFGLFELLVTVPLTLWIVSSVLKSFGARILYDVCELLFFFTSIVFNSDSAWRALGGIMVRRRHYNRAVKYYKKAISKNLDSEFRVDSEIFLDYSYAAMKAGFIKDAITFGDKACRVADSLLDAKGSRMGEARQHNLRFHAHCYQKYGIILANSGNYKKAESILSKSLKSEPESAHYQGDSVITTYKYLVEVSFFLQKEDEVSLYCQDAKEYFESKNCDFSKESEVNLKFCSALLAIIKGDYLEAESMLIDTVKDEIKLGRFDEVGQCYYYLGALYYRIDNLSLSKKYFELVREIFQDSYINPSGYHRKSTLALMKIMNQDTQFASDIVLLEEDLERANFEYKRINR